MERQSSCKFGIPPVKRDLKPSLAVIIRAPMVLLSPMISLTENLSPRSQNGWVRWISMRRKIFRGSSLVTRKIWKTRDKCHTKRPRSLPTTLTSDSWRLRPRSPSTSRRLSPSWLERSRERSPHQLQREMLTRVPPKSASQDPRNLMARREAAAEIDLIPKIKEYGANLYFREEQRV